MYLLKAATAVVRIGTAGARLDEQMVLLLSFVAAVTGGESSRVREAPFGTSYLLGLGMRKAAWTSGPCNLYPRARDYRRGWALWNHHW